MNDNATSGTHAPEVGPADLRPTAEPPSSSSPPPSPPPGRTTARHPAATLRPLLRSERVLAAVATAAAGLSVVSLWWAALAVPAALLAGWRAERTRPTALALVAALSLGVVATSLTPAWLAPGSRVVAALAAAVVLPWFAGRFWRQYQQLVQAGWERVEQLERAQRLVAERARLRERARIAQDMHDLLGHDLSMIALSAGALQLAPDLAEPHRQTAQAVRARAADAVERLGEVIGVLREPTGASPATASDTDLARLIDQVSASGLTVRWSVEGEAGRLPAAGARAAHRVVQEALTNVAKHAPQATATVRVRHRDAETQVVVENPVPPVSQQVSATASGTSANGRSANGTRPAGDPCSAPAGGSGLIGLDERVRLAGGTFSHGPRDGRFTVVAHLPHAPRAQPATLAEPSAADGQPPAEPRRARRRLVWALTACVMVPLVGGAALGGGLLAWQALTTSWSVLEPEDYAQLRVGQQRAEVAPVLPSRQTIERSSAAEPKGAGIRCEYYAMTADPFDDRSGDAYRLCFRGDVLVSLDALTA